MRITRSEWLNAIQKYKETIYTQILGEDRGEKNVESIIYTKKRKQFFFLASN